MSFGMNLLRGGTIVTFASILGRGSMFFCSVIVARLLSREGFGAFALVWATMTTGSVIASFSLDATATKFLAQYYKQEPERAGRVIGCILLVASLIMVFIGSVYAAAGSWIAGSVLKHAEVAPLLLVSTLGLLGRTLDGFLASILLGLGAWTSLAVARVFYGVGALVITFLFTSLWALKGAVWGVSIAYAWGVALLLIAVWRKMKAARVILGLGAWQEISEVLRFAFPLYIVKTASLCLPWVGVALLVRQTNGMLGMALFGVGDRLRLMTMFVPANLMMVALALLAQSHEQDCPSSFRRNAGMNIRMVLIVGFLTMIAVSSLSHIVASMLYGAEFAKAVPVILLLQLACFLSCVAAIMVQIFRAMSRNWMIVGVFLMSGLVFVVCSAVLVPGHGALSLALAHVISQCAGIVCWAIVLKRVVKCSIYHFWGWFIVLPVFVSAAAYMNFLSFVPNVVGACVLMAALLACLYRFFFTPEERQKLVETFLKSKRKKI